MLRREPRGYAVVLSGEADLEPLPPVVCDGGAIEQVLANLLTNAHDAGGTVTLATRAFAGQVEVVLSVTDTGPGIPDDVAPRVFDPFFPTKEIGHGTGQGLAIARAIVDRHGGTLTFRTRAGRGTTFYVRLPVSSASASAARA